MSNDTHDSLKQELQEIDCVMEKGSESLIKRFIGVGGQPKDVIRFLAEGYRGFPEMVNLLQKWASIAGFSAEETHQMIVSHTKSIIKATFDPQKADLLFTQAQAPPAWLEDIVNEKEWRTLIYELSEQHKKCLMLSFAVQRIAEAGHHEEIGTLSTAAQHFSVFRGVFEKSLERVLHAQHTDFDQSLPKFLKLACHSAHTVLFSQSVLYSMEKLSSDEIIQNSVRRISQELDRHLHRVMTPGQKLWLKIRHLLLNPPNGIVAPLESILFTDSTSPGDMIKLHTSYVSDQPPPLRFIRDPALLELLSQDLFSDSSSVQESFLKKYCFLVAFACSYQEADSEEENNARREKTMEAIFGVSSLCKQPPPVSTSEFIKAGKELDKHLDVSIAGVGVLKYVRKHLTNASFFQSPSGSFITPMFFYLLRRIVVAHPHQRESVFQLLTDCFDLDTTLDVQSKVALRKSVLTQMLYLVYHGYIFPVVEKMFQYCLSIDHSLIRHFITELLDNMEPPYSTSFYDAVIRLLSTTAGKESLSVCPTPVLQFLESAPDGHTSDIQELKAQFQALAENKDSVSQ